MYTYSVNTKHVVISEDIYAMLHNVCCPLIISMYNLLKSSCKLAAVSISKQNVKTHP